MRRCWKSSPKLWKPLPLRHRHRNRTAFIRALCERWPVLYCLPFTAYAGLVTAPTMSASNEKVATQRWPKHLRRLVKCCAVVHGPAHPPARCFSRFRTTPRPPHRDQHAGPTTLPDSHALSRSQSLSLWCCDNFPFPNGVRGVVGSGKRESPRNLQDGLSHSR